MDGVSFTTVILTFDDFVLTFLCPARYDRRDIIFPGFRPSVRPSHFRGTTLRAAPSKTMPFQQIINHALHCQHDVDVHLLSCVDLDLQITLLLRSCLTRTFFVDSH